MGVFSPSQIKSADPITRDNQGNVIPLSERFNPATEDIRYMPEEEATPQAKALLIGMRATHFLQLFETLALKGSRARQRDRSYMAAVAAGDREEQQRLVDEAAKWKGPFYHRSGAKEIEEFYPWTNFGTEEQAAAVDLTGRSDGTSRTYKVYLSILNPLRVEDQGMGACSVMEQAMEQGVVSSKEYSAFPFNQGTYIERAYVIKILRSKGYDGLVYSNEWEGKGDSFITFTPSQIKFAESITRDNQGNVIPFGHVRRAGKDTLNAGETIADDNTGRVKVMRRSEFASDEEWDEAVRKMDADLRHPSNFKNHSAPSLYDPWHGVLKVVRPQFGNWPFAVEYAGQRVGYGDTEEKAIQAAEQTYRNFHKAPLRLT